MSASTVKHRRDDPPTDYEIKLCNSMRIFFNGEPGYYTVDPISGALNRSTACVESRIVKDSGDESR